jgi:hypothetical protein
MMKRKPDFFICPHCGMAVKSSARVCPQCGSDHETGWSDGDYYDDSDSVENEHDVKPIESRAWQKYIVPVIAVLLVCVLLTTMLSWGIFIVPVVLMAAGIAFYATQIYPKTPRGIERGLARELLSLVNGDTDRMERLIVHEMMRRPESSRAEATDSAIYRLTRDRR